MIKVIINKKETEIEENLTLDMFIKTRNSQRIAIWINGVQIPKAEYMSRVIVSGDDIKIMPIIAGG
jgi:thiamine biosynthesis protein ThiS